MAAGDRNKSGRATDIVTHFVPSILPVSYPFCKQKMFWSATTRWEDVTCKKCLKAKEKSDDIERALGDGPSMAQAFHPNRLLNELNKL